MSHLGQYNPSEYVHFTQHRTKIALFGEGRILVWWAGGAVFERLEPQLYLHAKNKEKHEQSHNMIELIKTYKI